MKKFAHVNWLNRDCQRDRIDETEARERKREKGNKVRSVENDEK